MEILNVFETVKNSVEIVRDKVDYVVVFYHGGLERDLESGNPTENLTGENVGYEICDKISGIDVLVTGHNFKKTTRRNIRSHSFLLNFVYKTYY